MNIFTLPERAACAMTGIPCGVRLVRAPTTRSPSILASTAVTADGTPVLMASRMAARSVPVEMFRVDARYTVGVAPNVSEALHLGNSIPYKSNFLSRKTESATSWTILNPKMYLEKWCQT